MSDYGIPENEVKACIDAFDRQTKKDDEKERNYLTYDELKDALEEVLGSKFKRDNIFFKLVSELENLEPNRVRFLDFLEVYKKYKRVSAGSARTTPKTTTRTRSTPSSPSAETSTTWNRTSTATSSSG